MATMTGRSGGNPLPPVTIHFLGTCSGGGPIISRNCSSLAVDFGNDVWLFDAADGTLPRLHKSSLKISNISRIFITHMHADHVLGTISILMTIMSGVGTSPESLEQLKSQGTSKKANVHLYGPKGLRRLIRTTLEITSVTLAGAYAVHEILAGETPSVECTEDQLHTNEAVGRDILANEDGVWCDVLIEGKGKNGKGWGVTAGPIEHRVPSLGYIIQEPTPRLPLETTRLIPLLQSNAPALAKLEPTISHPLSLLSYLTTIPSPLPYTLPSGDILYPPEPSGVSPRKLVVFGDCAGGTLNPVFQKMCQDSSVLIHECTNGAIPELIQRGDKGRKARMKGMDAGLVKRSEEQTGKPVGVETSSSTKACQDEDEAIAEREKENVAGIRKKAQSRGHSMPTEVGEFAKSIGARRVIVNHFSAMFPSPRYHSSEALPSLLSPMSPFPYPSPHPPRSSESVMMGIPVTTSDLHIRLITQSLVDQIRAVADPSSHRDQSSRPSGGTRGEETTNAARPRMIVAARDFMVVRIPSHELSEIEVKNVIRAQDEAESVMSQWRENGGLWVDDEEKRWVGVEPPSQQLECRWSDPRLFQAVSKSK